MWTLVSPSDKWRLSDLFHFPHNGYSENERNKHIANLVNILNETIIVKRRSPGQDEKIKVFLGRRGFTFIISSEKSRTFYPPRGNKSQFPSYPPLSPILSITPALYGPLWKNKTVIQSTNVYWSSTICQALLQIIFICKSRGYIDV